MTIAQIETQVKTLASQEFSPSFFYDLLLAYGLPKASVARVQKGNLNISKVDNEILWKKRLYSRIVQKGETETAFEEMKGNTKELKSDPRFIAVTDLENLKAFDSKTKESLSIPLSELTKEYAFFLPWAGMEKTVHQNENPADVKAAERMGKLYDEIRKDNPIQTKAEIHELNVFLSRLLFCYFAEDTAIFPKGLFTNTVSSYTQADGSDLQEFLEKLFFVLNTESRKDVPTYLASFPFVNGNLFKDPIKILKFSAKSRAKLIEAGEDDWSVINPDIFGSMIQAVVDPSQRGSLGMHYTSVPNIMKVIEPLFLNELRQEFEKARLNGPKLNKLLGRLGKIKIFDPACGSGNFLIIAYKELRKLEMQILEDLQTLYRYASGFEKPQLELIPKAQLSIGSVVQPSLFSTIQLSQFFGIEIDDFAHEIAILSLWLAQHQMNVAFKEAFGSANPSLPLKEGGNIVPGNATRLDWEVVCPKKEGDEIYILGNPPYYGARLLDASQKQDMKIVFSEYGVRHNDLDYVSCWILKASAFIGNSENISAGLVSTNSICQGSQVPEIWPTVLSRNIEIHFCHSSFKWENSAKGKAAVICVILGIRLAGRSGKFIFNGNLKHDVKNISPYLVNSSSIIVYSRTEALSDLPKMSFGNMPNDNGNLILTSTELDEECLNNPNLMRFIRKFTGSNSFINDVKRFCIWVESKDFADANQIEFIRNRALKVKEYRQASDRLATQKLADRSYNFAEIRHLPTQSIIIPRHSSENREYIPIGFLDDSTIIGDSALAIYSANAWHFAILTSKMHMLWVSAVGGRIKSDFRYSAQICYNTFPFPSISDAQKKILEHHVDQVLQERERHSEKTLAQIYDPEKMPAGLRHAHQQLDLAVERCYRSHLFESDEKKLEYLFQLYEQMIEDEKSRGTLFEGLTKKKEKKKKK